MHDSKLARPLVPAPGRRRCASAATAGPALSLVLALLLAGCAGKPTGPRFEALAPPDAGSSLIYIYRDDTLRGAGPTPVRVDDQKVAKLKNGEYLALIVDPGLHQVAGALMWFELLARSWNEIDVQPGPGETVYVKLWAATAALPPTPTAAEVPGQGNAKGDVGLYMGLVDEGRARQELRSMRRADHR